ncbi:MAG: hypothetical protein H7Y04_11855 [Verrucomicrobia bacterium]|nr:hypothetical protein [Cytophagales bacterium]
MSVTYHTNSLRREKITFGIIIGILLFSLIYISSSTLILKNENIKFRNQVQITKNEIDVLVNYRLPIKDSVIEGQKIAIQEKMKQIEELLVKSKNSEEGIQLLNDKLNLLKQQAVQLRLQIAKVEKKQLLPQDLSDVRKISEKDSLIRLYQQQIAELRREVESINKKSRTTVITETVVQERDKISAFYFSARPSDRKNRASKTEFVFIQLQLRGEISTMNCTSLQVEIRDPNNVVITDQLDKIKASTDFKTEYLFKPAKRYLIKGKYSVRIYCESSGFQHVDFFTLV